MSDGPNEKGVHDEMNTHNLLHITFASEIAWSPILSLTLEEPSDADEWPGSDIKRGLRLLGRQLSTRNGWPSRYVLSWRTTLNLTLVGRKQFHERTSLLFSYRLTTPSCANTVDRFFKCLVSTIAVTWSSSSLRGRIAHCWTDLETTYLRLVCKSSIEEAEALAIYHMEEWSDLVDVPSDPRRGCWI